MNQYLLPSIPVLSGAANSAVLANLVYTCNTCECTCGNVQSLKDHIAGAKHKKKTEANGNTENAAVVGKLAKYVALEAPHREAGKQAKGVQGKAFLEKVKAFKAGMTKEEQKAHEVEKKRKRQEEGTETAGKAKKPKVEPFTCKCCNMVITGDVVVVQHISGHKHKNKAKACEGGCWMCGLPGRVDASHFEGKKHLKAAELLAAKGVDVETVNAQLEEMQPVVAQMPSKKQKAAAAQQGLVQPHKGVIKTALKQKAGNGVVKMAQLKRDPNDPTCWNFKQGKCNKGELCKFEHS